MGTGLWSVTHVTDGLIGRGTARAPARLINNIDLSTESGLDLQREFADPEHRDYRLRATSRFRGKGVDGKDLGPFPYPPNIFHVNPGGNDDADGLSAGAAWKTLARSVDCARVAEMKVSHCFFTGFQSAAIALSDSSLVNLNGNLYDNPKGPALQLTDTGLVRYSSFNSYCPASPAWAVNGKAPSLAEAQQSHDRQSRELQPEFEVSDGVASLKTWGRPQTLVALEKSRLRLPQGLRMNE